MLIMVAISSTSEEIGWRGYALPRLAARFGLRRASLILGLIWATWHLPLFFSTSTNPYRQSFPMYALSVTAISVVFAWLYDKTNGSLLLAALLHTSMNVTLLFLPQPESAAAVFARPTEPVSWIFTALLWIAAGYLLQRMRRFDSKNLR
jgi:membrane protease YdiL (CAAX protease family)